MKRTSTLSVFATTCVVLLALSFLYAIALCAFHGNLMYLRLWRNLLTIAWIAAEDSWLAQARTVSDSPISTNGPR